MGGGEHGHSKGHQHHGRIAFGEGADPAQARNISDMSSAHIWDQSGVGALNQLIRKLRQGGSEVEVVGLNTESLDLFERIGAQPEASHG